MAASREVHAVTGAFSYTGTYIASRLREIDIDVRALVRRVPANSDHGFDCRPLQFADAGRLADDLSGVTVLYNTYWIRFERGGMTFGEAVRNTAILAQAANQAGVKRIVHLSVSNPSPTSPFAYFRGKAAAEEAVIASGVPCSIIRPTLVFGDEDILINNIAWILRRVHVFVMPGRGDYRVQPVFVKDVPILAVDEAKSTGNITLDAAGPETMAFSSLLRVLRDATKAKAVVLKAPLPLALLGGRLMSIPLGDTLIIDEELGALMAETLVSSQPPTARTRFSEWAASHGDSLGHLYTSEMNRHWKHT